MSEHPPAGSVTEMLAQARSGDSSALAKAFPLIYEELRRIARQQLQREPDGHTLTPTALVHEAYMRLVEHYTRVEWTGAPTSWPWRRQRCAESWWSMRAAIAA